jgi:hypothetical protein
METTVVRIYTGEGRKAFIALESNTLAGLHSAVLQRLPDLPPTFRLIGEEDDGLTSVDIDSDMGWKVFLLNKQPVVFVDGKMRDLDF